MALSGIGYGASLYGANAVSSLVSEATKKPLERLNKSVESTKVQLSAFGQLKSATAQIESAGKTLQNNSKLTSFDEVKKAVQGLATALNSQRTAVNQVSGSDRSVRSETSGALSGDLRARSAASDVRQALQGNGGSKEAALKQIGVSFASDGSVKLDAKKLEQAYQSDPGKVTDTLNRIGREMADVAGKELAGSGNVGGSINRLNERLGGLQQSQVNYQSWQQSSQRTIDQRNQQMEQAQTQTQQAFGLTGTSAYMGVFSF